jgi:hypothetical protein
LTRWLAQLGIGPTSSGTSGLKRFSFLEKFCTRMAAFGTVVLDLGSTTELNLGVSWR